MWCKTIENWINHLIRAGLFSAHKQNDQWSLSCLNSTVSLTLLSWRWTLCDIQPTLFCIKDIQHNKMALVLLSKDFQLQLQVNHQTWSNSHRKEATTLIIVILFVKYCMDFRQESTHCASAVYIFISSLWKWLLNVRHYTTSLLRLPKCCTVKTWAVFSSWAANHDDLNKGVEGLSLEWLTWV